MAPDRVVRPGFQRGLILAVAVLAAVAARGVGAADAGVTAVTVTPPTAAAGSGSVTLTFRAPSQANTAGMVGFSVNMPTDHPFADVTVHQEPGWAATPSTTPLTAPVTEAGITITEAVTSVTWTALPGTRIGPGGFAEFTVTAGPVPTTDSLQFPATQTYDNGTVIRWDEPPPASGQETLHPVPTLTITGPTISKGAGSAPNDGSNHTAIVALVIVFAVAAAGLLVGMLALRRRRARPAGS